MRKDIQLIYKRLSDTWPSNFPIEVKASQARFASSYIQRHPDLIKGLVEENEDTWHYFIEKVRSTSGLQRGRYGPNPSQTDKLIEASWLASPILNTKKEFILQRLSTHWKNANRTLVQSRLNKYAGIFGLLTSVEPLLSEENKIFIKAADAIYCPSAPKGERHVGAGEIDLLHQMSSTIDVASSTEGTRAETNVRRKPKFSRLQSSRLTSGQEWMTGKTPEEILRIHESIRSHLVDKVSNATVNKFYVGVNKFLQMHQGYIKQIEDGEDQAAWRVAKQVVKRVSLLKYPA